ncbi:unnamed protein product [Meloidogyne enterolobii]|uniref:Uncharacterized protein n=2 Tax=Meloidogyne enterolobii TaxID=390850 RepID=A0ACB1ASA2_MELEN
MECDLAIFENDYLNKYLLSKSIGNDDKRVTCKLDKGVSVKINNPYNYINKLSEIERNAEERINLAMKKGKNVGMAAGSTNYRGIKIGENKAVQHRGKAPSGHFNRIQNVQNKGKGKMIESDDETPNINEKNENPAADTENFWNTFGTKHSNEYLGEHKKLIEININ